MKNDEYAPNIDEPHFPDLVPLTGPNGERLVGELPMTKRDWLHQLARWYSCPLGSIPVDALERFELTREEEVVATLDAAVDARDTRGAADFASHFYAPAAEEPVTESE